MLAMSADRAEILEEELIILRNSGEIPEIALHTSLFYLTEDEDGPQITLEAHEQQALCEAALARACEIVLRDLDPANRDLRIYRGPARSMANWYRLQKLCARMGLACPGFRETVAGLLVAFLATELQEVGAGCRTSSVNCTARDIEKYCRELGLDLSALPRGWQNLCPE